MHPKLFKQLFNAMALRVLSRDGGCVICGDVHCSVVSASGRYEMKIKDKLYLCLCGDCRMEQLKGRLMFDENRKPLWLS